jgi:hypothetical protein
MDDSIERQMEKERWRSKYPEDIWTNVFGGSIRDGYARRGWHEDLAMLTARVDNLDGEARFERRRAYERLREFFTPLADEAEENDANSRRALELLEGYQNLIRKPPPARASQQFKVFHASVQDLLGAAIGFLKGEN